MEKIIDRIRKLFALAESPNEAEAISAMEKAHALLLQYNLTLNDINKEQKTDIQEIVFAEVGRIRGWKKLLIYYVTKANYCSFFTSVYHGSYKNGIEGKQVINIVGRNANIISAKEMLEYIFESIERLAKNKKHNEKESYKIGFTESICIRLKEIWENEHKKIETCTALIIVDDELKRYMNQKNLLSKQNQAPKVKDENGYVQGREDGNNFSLNGQINGHKAQMAIS